MYNEKSAIACRFASKDAARTTIQGVSLPGDGSVVGTDGYKLVIISPSKGFNAEEFPALNEKQALSSHQPRIISAPQFEKALKEIPKKQLLPILGYAAVTTDNGYFGLTTTDLDVAKETIIKPIEGNFPKYKEILLSVENEEPIVEFGVNPKYLMELMKAFCDFTDETEKDPKTIKITIYGALRPLVMDAKNARTEQTMKGVLMPAKIG